MSFAQRLLLGAAFLGLAAGQAAADQSYPAVLAGHAALPAATFVVPPQDAPPLFHSAGKYTIPGTVTRELYAVEGTSFLSEKGAPRSTGLFLPFVGQPIQGFSGIKSLGDGTFMVLLDNGFGSKANSADAMLSFHRVQPDWQTGRVRVLETHFLSDPEGRLPFRIVTEASDSRFLTGADLDVESIQPVGDSVWFGDEFGPYLIETDARGFVKAVYPVEVEGKAVRSPDHPALGLPATPGAVTFDVRRSRGLEGMAASKDGRFLYPMLEGPLWDAGAQAWETQDGREFLRIVEFDVQARAYSGRSWKYALEVNGNNIGDFNMIDETRGLIIERDNGEGTADRACQGEAKSDCFNVPAVFKRIYLVDLGQADDAGFVKKVAYIDLMNIQDPNGKALWGSRDGVFTFPFVTIEDVDLVDATHIVVANDNNLPYSAGREPNRQDDNEMILLEVGDFLQAR